MIIKEGLFYRTRDGRKVGPMVDRGPETGGDRWGGSGPNITSHWYEDGRHWLSRESRDDLVAEWTDEPAPAQPSVVEALAEALEEAIEFARAANHILAGGDPQEMVEWEAALALYRKGR